MRDARWAVLLLTLAAPACGSGFDAKSAADGTRVIPATPAPAVTAVTAVARTPASTCAATEPCTEPFAIAAVGFDVDLFETRPALALPADATLSIGRSFGTRGDGPLMKSIAGHSAKIDYPGDIDAFERDVGAPLRAVLKAPPGTWVAYERQVDWYTHQMTARPVVLRLPLLVTSADVTSARADDYDAGVIDLNKTSAENAANGVKGHGVWITLSAPATARLASWIEQHPKYPIAILLHGRVVNEGPMGGKLNEWFVKLPWLPPQSSKLAAETLADELEAKK